MSDTTRRAGGAPGPAKVGGPWRVYGATRIAWMEAGGEQARGKSEGHE